MDRNPEKILPAVCRESPSIQLNKKTSRGMPSLDDRGRAIRLNYSYFRAALFTSTSTY